MWDMEDDAANPALTARMIEDAESELNVIFPVAYIDALKVKNGGSVKGDLVPLADQDVPEHLLRYIDYGHVSVRGVNGIGHGHTSVLRTSYLVAEWGLPEGLVLIDGDGHWWIAFDFREQNEDPPIVFVESDSGDTLRIASSFAEFFSSFVNEDDLFDEDGNFIGVN